MNDREQVAQALHRIDRHRAVLSHREAEVPTWSLLPEDRREVYLKAADAAIATMRQVPGVCMDWTPWERGQDH